MSDPFRPFREVARYQEQVEMAASDLLSWLPSYDEDAHDTPPPWEIMYEACLHIKALREDSQV